MTDISPVEAIDRLQENGKTGHSLLTDISQTLGSIVNQDRSERWKQRLREELVREHISAQQQKNPPFKSLLQWLLKKD